jgi:hypothetical protein
MPKKAAATGGGHGVNFIALVGAAEAVHDGSEGAFWRRLCLVLNF